MSKGFECIEQFRSAMDAINLEYEVDDSNPMDPSFYLKLERGETITRCTAVYFDLERELAFVDTMATVNFIQGRTEAAREVANTLNEGSSLGNSSMSFHGDNGIFLQSLVDLNIPYFETEIFKTVSNDKGLLTVLLEPFANLMDSMDAMIKMRALKQSLGRS